MATCSGRVTTTSRGKTCGFIIELAIEYFGKDRFIIKSRNFHHIMDCMHCTLSVNRQRGMVALV